MEMDNELEPYKNSESYRNLQPACLPSHVQRYLDFIDISKDGSLLLGCTNLTGRYWLGSLWYFSAPEAAPNVEKCLTGVDLEAGVCDGKFLEDQQKVIIGEDSGNIQVLSVSEVPEEKTYQFQLSSAACDHDDFISSLSVFKGKSKALSGSADLTIKVWDVDAMIADHTFRPAHTNQVTSVATQPVEDSSIFASCSLDGTVMSWDIRCAKPAQVLLQDTGFTAVDWQPSNTNVVAVGSIAGDVCFIDIREPKQKLSKISCFPRPLYRLEFDKNQLNQLGVCGDHNAVKMIDCTDIANPSICYEDNRHTDFVRGLAWHPKTNCLFSCGWDKQVLMHVPPQSSTASHALSPGGKAEPTDRGDVSSPQNMDVNGS